jgi:hypothetical protein
MGAIDGADRVGSAVHVVGSIATMDVQVYKAGGDVRSLYDRKSARHAAADGNDSAIAAYYGGVRTSPIG